jgi:ATP-dependent helicase/nuclease subunit B
VLAKALQVLNAADSERLSPAIAESLYGRELLTSVSGLEDYAACPFKFFVARGLQAREREKFEVDRREEGSFQHEALKEFHRQLQAQGGRWRNIAPDTARELIARIGEQLIPTFRNGVFQARDAGQFTARVLIRGLQNLVETLVRWAGQCEFDPHAVEISFGLDPEDLPPWRLDLSDGHALRLRGRIDRVDICRIGDSGEALATVIDYKSSAQELDRIKLHHGLELQLLAYLGVLRHLADARDQFEVWRLRPVGAFYVNLRGEFKAGTTRARVLAEREQVRQRGYQHRGRFDGDQLAKFDNTSARKGAQFRFSQKKDGTWNKRGNEALPTAQFVELLDTIEDFLRGYGREIYAGNAAVAPYRIKNETACQRCEFLSICRFDEWTENYRVLRLPADSQPAQKVL